MSSVISDFLDFTLRFTRTAGGYRITAECDEGEASGGFTLPFTDDELNAFITAVDSMNTATGGGLIPEPVKPTMIFGQSLHDALLSGPVRDLYIRVRHSAELAGKGVRLKLRLTDAPELASVPWEFMYDSTDFIALSPETVLVRYLDLPNAPRPMRLDLPLRILVTISDPHDLPPLDLEAEREKITTALASLTESGQVALHFTEDASLGALNRALSDARGRGEPFHVWHYIGHGQYNPAKDASTLAFTGPSGQATPVGGFQLGTVFTGAPEIRLALLNACEGARASGTDPFAGVSAALVERGIPAVIGMQFEIGDIAAVTLSEEFYRSLAAGLPVDAALTEARRAVFFAPNWVEWATPVLFMRVSEGRLFDMAQQPKRAVTVNDRPPSEQGEAAIMIKGKPFGRWWQQAMRNVDEVIERGRAQLAEQVEKVEKVDWGAFEHSHEMQKAREKEASAERPTPPPQPEPGTAQQKLGPALDEIHYHTVSGDLAEPWHIVLEVYTGEQPPPLIGLKLHGPIVLGRGRAPDEPPTFNLNPYKAREFGVSRRHLLLTPSAEGLTVTDQNSTNRTLINGQLAQPGEVISVGHNDALRLGRLDMALFVVDDE